MSKVGEWLYQMDKKRKLRVWTTWVEGNLVYTEFGVHGGQLQRSSYKAEPVNEGKKNARTAEEQAVFEAAAQHRKKMEKGWFATPEEAAGAENGFPMLAMKLLENMHVLATKAFVLLQRKLNGVRCFTTKLNETEIQYTSRNGKVYRQFTHLTPHLLRAMHVGQVLDGELYKHGVTLQKMSSLARKLSGITAEEMELVEYHIYDVADKTKTTEERNDIIGALQFEEGGPIFVVETFEADSFEDIKTAHDEWVRDGYEGIMVRELGRYYEFSNGTSRSSQLLKYKEFEEEEFEIVGVKDGVGKMEGVLMFQCKAKGGVFDVKMRGSMSVWRKAWEIRDTFIGKMLTVRFQAYTPYDIPEFPVGIVIRDYE